MRYVLSPFVAFALFANFSVSCSAVRNAIRAGVSVCRLLLLLFHDLSECHAFIRGKCFDCLQLHVALNIFQ